MVRLLFRFGFGGESVPLSFPVEAVEEVALDAAREDYGRPGSRKGRGHVAHHYGASQSHGVSGASGRDRSRNQGD